MVGGWDVPNSPGITCARRPDSVIYPCMKTRDFRVWGAAALAALCVLLAAWLLPLPRLVAGADELAAARLPQVRASVDATGSAFAKAQAGYLNYVGTHDMTALSTTLRIDI